MKSSLAVIGLLSAATLLLTSAAHGAATLTPAAVAQGFTLTTFLDGVPQNGAGVGPLATAYNSDGSVLVTDYAGGTVRKYATDTDGQHYVNFLTSVTYGGNNPAGLAQVGGHTYMTRQNTNQVIEIDANGNQVGPVIANINFATGIVVDPTNNHLLVSNGGQIFDVNPAIPGGAVSVYLNAGADGLSFTAAGDLYAAIGGTVQGFHHGSTSPFFNQSVAGADGTALGTGSLAGNIYVNSNNGFLEQINLTTLVHTTIFTSGSRGDFVTVDPNNGTLIISQSTSLLRLTAPTGGGFGTTPLPTSALMATPLIALLLSSRPSRRPAAF